jgi:hypothetical protein
MPSDPAGCKATWASVAASAAVNDDDAITLAGGDDADDADDADEEDADDDEEVDTDDGDDADHGGECPGWPCGPGVVADIYVCVCVCVCAYECLCGKSRETERERQRERERKGRVTREGRGDNRRPSAQSEAPCLRRAS